MAALRVDVASAEEARALLRTCCGSSRWVERMSARRPFGTLEGLLDAARAEWFALTPADWHEAFGAHPKIGDLSSLRERYAGTRDLAAHEQSGVNGASDDVLAALAHGNAAYEEKFGRIFIVCATGLTAEAMLARLRARLTNDPETEMGVAAAEQAMITDLRLKRLSST